jgi:hypothetical protein
LREDFFGLAVTGGVAVAGVAAEGVVVVVAVVLCVALHSTVADTAESSLSAFPADSRALGVKSSAV